ncbi:virulence factor Mce [Mycobacterium sp. IS-1496]|uniref:MCE family protein n=1 Tax=Mycobacterium sp. IS-1496 TaxID=1772284 RepID=UPI0007418240|nr:MlaD family protein [Mycobacterium sp. IS-1496]KUI38408.1 virulence factor Mce [Mycobacterium sp. IS-1496]
MLTRFVRVQLAVFAVASLVGVSVLIVEYLQVPTLLGVGRITVTMELPNAGGLYRFSNVTYRGVQIGKVTEVDVNPRGAVATLSLDGSPKVPSDLTAEVRSVSAVGEQYVDLQPHGRGGPFLQDGSVIPSDRTVIPQEVGPMMDRLSALIGSVPTDKLDGLLDESFKAFNGSAYDLQSLSDSASRIAHDTDAVADRTSRLIDDAQPVLDGQNVSAQALRTWADRLAGVTGQLVADDPHLRTILETGPGAAQEVSRLLDQVKPTLPVLLANLTSIGQIAVTYRPGLEQLLVLLPPATAFYQSAGPGQNATGIPLGDFRVSMSDPPACTVGFLPPSSWRSPADTTTIDTPDGLYCKLPQDSPIAVRGARNFPCMRHPGKYAPTIEECNSDRPFQPLAVRQHATGPYPLDPNLIAQGVPPDDRVTLDENIHGPIEGTPGAAPSGHTGDGPAPGPTVAVATYDPETGRVAAPDGHIFEQSDLASSGADKTWKDLVMSGSG